MLRLLPVGACLERSLCLALPRERPLPPLGKLCFISELDFSRIYPPAPKLLQSIVEHKAELSEPETCSVEGQQELIIRPALHGGLHGQESRGLASPPRCWLLVLTMGGWWCGTCKGWTETKMGETYYPPPSFRFKPKFLSIIICSVFGTLVPFPY